MKILKILGLGFALLASCITSQAITNTMIAVSGTNIVLSWPSFGYENYLIQYRQTLDPSDEWSTVTNAYPANSTNLTTFTLYGLIPLPDTNSAGGEVIDGPPPSPDVMMAAPADNSAGAIPLALYPPGFDLSGLNIFDPSSHEWMSGSGYSVSSALRLHPLDDGGSPDDLTNALPTVTTGFFRVFHIPNWLANFDGYTFDGPTFIPVDYESPDAPTNSINNTTVLINGQETPYATLISENIGGVNYWGMGIYFDRLPNGTNTIQLLSTVQQDVTQNDSTPYMTFSNAPQTIVIGNLVNFTNWDDLVWNNTNYTFKAVCSVGNVDWEVDIYDVNGFFVNSLTGHSDDGNISATWDLTDYTGAVRNTDDDPDFYPYITITPDSEGLARIGGAHPDAGGGSSTRPMPAVAKPFPEKGGWLVAYQDHYYSDGRTNDESADTAKMISGINTIAGAASEWEFPVTEFPIAFGRTYAQTNRNTSWANLTSWLYYPQTRNFYYYGHGSQDAFGGDVNTISSSNGITGAISLPGSIAFLTSQTLSANIAFNPNGARPYRFVYLDACNTANGNLAPAFGIPKEAHGGGWFVSSDNTRNIRPCAYVGWNTEVGAGGVWGTVEGYWNFRKVMISDWSTREEEALDNALNVARDTAGWVPPAQVTEHLMIQGDTELEYLQYNYGGDWP